MFAYLKLRFFVARVQAELKAQYDDQEFVNLICQHPANLETLADIEQHAYYKKTTISPFLATCQILGGSLDLADIAFEKRLICCELLSQRLAKARRDPHFRLQHIMIFGALEEKLLAWIDTNQREFPQR